MSNCKFFNKGLCYGVDCLRRANLFGRFRSVIGEPIWWAPRETTVVGLRVYATINLHGTEAALIIGTRHNTPLSPQCLPATRYH